MVSGFIEAVTLHADIVASCLGADIESVERGLDELQHEGWSFASAIERSYLQRDRLRLIAEWEQIVGAAMIAAQNANEDGTLSFKRLGPQRVAVATSSGAPPPRAAHSRCRAEA
jgi:hypothetical protein